MQMTIVIKQQSINAGGKASPALRLYTRFSPFSFPPFTRATLPSRTSHFPFPWSISTSPTGISESGWVLFPDSSCIRRTRRIRLGCGIRPCCGGLEGLIHHAGPVAHDTRKGVLSHCYNGRQASDGTSIMHGGDVEGENRGGLYGEEVPQYNVELGYYPGFH